MSAFKKAWLKVIALSWEDESYRQRLLADPAAVLAEAGAELPQGVELRIAEDTETVKWLVLPTPPASGMMEEAEERLAAWW